MHKYLNSAYQPNWIWHQTSPSFGIEVSVVITVQPSSLSVKDNVNTTFSQGQATIDLNQL
jgi:hypothetical protein